MKIIYKVNKKNRNARCVLFGLKNLSTFENEITLEELKDIKNEEIFLAMEKNMFNSDLVNLENVVKEIDNYNIKGVLFYDLAVLNIFRKYNIKTPLIWNQNFLVTNYETCNFYQNDGVKGAVVSSEITIEEIEELAKNTKLDLFVNIFGYSLMAISKRKLLTNYFKYIGEINDNKINYMIQRGEKYPLIEINEGTKFYTKNILNGIRYINRLKKANIKYLIIDDNFIEESLFEKVAEIYEQVVKTNFNDAQLLEKESEIQKVLNNVDISFFNRKTIYKVKKK